MKAWVAAVPLLLGPVACSDPGGDDETGSAGLAAEAAAFNSPEEIQRELGDLAGRCDPPQAEPPFVRCVTSDGIQLTLTAYGTSAELKALLAGNANEIPEPDRADPDHAENDPRFHVATLLGDTWAISAVNESGPVASLLERARARIGGQLVERDSVRSTLDATVAVLEARDDSNS